MNASARYGSSVRQRELGQRASTAMAQPTARRPLRAGCHRRRTGRPGARGRRRDSVPRRPHRTRSARRRLPEHRLRAVQGADPHRAPLRGNAQCGHYGAQRPTTSSVDFTAVMQRMRRLRSQISRLGFDQAPHRRRHRRVPRPSALHRDIPCASPARSCASTRQWLQPAPVRIRRSWTRTRPGS